VGVVHGGGSRVAVLTHRKDQVVGRWRGGGIIGDPCQSE
jgi:hypothetical protein